MKAYSLLAIFIFIYCIYKYTSVEIMPELKRNILNFGYRSNFQYEGMLLYSFDKFYVVMKFVLPTTKDLKFSPIEFHSTCNYLDVDVNMKHFPTQFILTFKIYCRIIMSFVDFYKKLIRYIWKWWKQKFNSSIFSFYSHILNNCLYCIK